MPQLSLMTRADDGFWLRADERSRMEDIDSRLKMLLPAEEFELLTSASPVNFTTRSDRVIIFCIYHLIIIVQFIFFPQFHALDFVCIDARA